jgi:hypothetical protein
MIEESGRVYDMWSIFVVIYDSYSVMFNRVMLVIVNLSKRWLQLIQEEPLVQWLPFWQQPSVDIGWVIVNLSSTYTVSFLLDLNCNCSYYLLAQFVLIIFCFFKTWYNRNSSETTSFQINKPSTTIVHIVDICIYIYIVFFPKKSLYSLWLYTNSYSVWSLTTSLSLNYVVITYTLCLFKTRSHHHGLIYTS